VPDTARGPFAPVTLEQETQHLLQLYDRDAGKIMGEIRDQLSIVAGRAQTLLSLAGITITVTGFSGASIAQSGKIAAGLLVTGLVVVLLAASIAITGILRVRWTTSIAPCSLEEAVRSALEVRDRKSIAYDRALQLLVVGLLLYVSSIGILLLGSMPR
jgi:hypothetical protein